MPEVSVIITTYNRAHLAEEAVKSVLAQSFKDYEIILVDAGSTDETENTLKKYPLKYVRRKRSGISRARNMGIAESCGKFVCFLDSDDLWLKDKLKIQRDFMEKNSGCPLCYTDEIWKRNGKNLNQKKIHEKCGGDIFRKCLLLCIISPSSAMIRREILGDEAFDEKMPVCEDYDLWLRISSAYEIGYIPEKLIIKRGGHSDQLSRKHPVMDRFRIYSIRKLLKNGLKPQLREAARRELERKCRIVSSGALKRGRIITALTYWAAQL